MIYVAIRLGIIERLIDLIVNQGSMVNRHLDSRSDRQSNLGSDYSFTICIPSP